MAGLDFKAVTSALALTSATTTTALQIIAASTNKVRVKSLEVSFPDTSTTNAPAFVRVLRQTTAIGGSPTTVTPVKVRNGDAGTIQTTAKKSAGGSEPTASDVYWSGYLHQQGRHGIPLGPNFLIEQGDRLGVEITSSAPINCGVVADCEE